MKKSLPCVCFLGALLVTAIGCSKEVYYDYEGPQVSLFKTVVENPGKNCVRGGQRVSFGSDVNGNGILDDHEVISVEYICNGIYGGEAMVRVVDDHGAPACPYGGQRIDVGLDWNRNGNLDDDEVQDSHFVCSDARTNTWNQVEDVAAAGDFTCGRMKNAGVACWGASVDGTDQATAPVAVDGLSKAAGFSAGCLVSPQGYVECWKGVDNSPRRIPNILNAFAISGTPARHVCAIYGEKAGAKCWGSNTKGQLGDGTLAGSDSPVEVFTSVGERLEGISAISAGAEHTCAIAGAKNEVWCWGSNNFGQLGAASDNALSTGAVRVVDDKGEALIGATAVAAGGEHSCAVISSGVRCWGGNSAGQIGDKIAIGSVVSHAVAVQDGGQELPPASALALGQAFSCVLLKSGSAKCWGDNSLGQLGGRTQAFTSAIPVTVIRASDNSTLGKIQKIAAGDDHACAVVGLGDSNTSSIDKATVVMCWGRSNRGQLGNSVTQNYEEVATTPVPVTSLENKESLVLGANHGCAKKTDSSAVCWGLNEGGQLGSDKGTRWLFSDVPLSVIAVGAVEAATEASSSTTATPVLESMTTIRSLASGPLASHTCAILMDNTMACWGRNGSGQLGEGIKSYWKTPLFVQKSATEVLGSVTSAALGKAHTCALTDAGAALCWGSNAKGQLGSAVAEESLTPAAVSGSNSFQALAAGDEFTCGLLTSRAAKCWGDGSDGQLGNGIQNSSNTPVQVSSLSNLDSIRAGGKHACALKAGMLWCWGNNAYGQLGQGTQDNSAVPVRIAQYNPAAATLPVTDYCLGYYHTCAVLNDGTLWCWGNNAYGQLGIGTRQSVNKPVRVNGMTDIASVTCGTAHTCATASNGNVSCWGRNDYAQIGHAAGQVGAAEGAVMP